MLKKSTQNISKKMPKLSPRTHSNDRQKVKITTSFQKYGIIIMSP